jgi:hypothetical protein
VQGAFGSLRRSPQYFGQSSIPSFKSGERKSCGAVLMFQQPSQFCRRVVPAETIFQSSPCLIGLAVVERRCNCSKFFSGSLLKKVVGQAHPGAFNDRFYLVLIKQRSRRILAELRIRHRHQRPSRLRSSCISRSDAFLENDSRLVAQRLRILRQPMALPFDVFGEYSAAALRIVTT